MIMLVLFLKHVPSSTVPSFSVQNYIAKELFFLQQTFCPCCHAQMHHNSLWDIVKPDVECHPASLCVLCGHAGLDCFSLHQAFFARWKNDCTSCVLAVPFDASVTV
jgi:hypothetical protein